MYIYPCLLCIPISPKKQLAQRYTYAANPFVPSCIFPTAVPPSFLLPFLMFSFITFFFPFREKKQ